jgi:HAD superfamily hydrolase (TIGR01549 family)
MLLSQVTTVDEPYRDVVSEREGVHSISERRWREPYWQPMTDKNIEINVVLFDWDLTLARVLGEVSSNERLAALFQQEGLPYTPDEIQTAVGHYQADVEEGRLRELNTPPQTRQDVIHFYRHLLTRLGHSESSWKLANQLYSAYSYLPTMLYEDCLPTLRALREKGLTLGIISNHATSARKVMQTYVGEYIPPEHIIISQEVGVHKPAKTIFRRAAARLRMPPTNCMFVGDNLLVDAVGAVDQGGFARGLWLDRQDAGASLPLPSGVSRIISLTEVLEFV